MLSQKTSSTPAGRLESATAPVPAAQADGPASDPSIPHWVAQVYEAAAPDLQSRLLAHLLRPLGLLSLVAVANGIFARMIFRSGSPELLVRAEDAQSVQASDVAALIDFVQQVNVEYLEGLAQMITASSSSYDWRACRAGLPVLPQSAGPTAGLYACGLTTGPTAPARLETSALRYSET